MEQTYDNGLKEDKLDLTVGLKKPDKNISVIVFEIEGELKVDKSILQQPDKSILLPAHMAKLRPSKKDTELSIDRSSIAVGWKDTDTAMVWELKVSEPGNFQVALSTAAVQKPREWIGGHSVELSIARGTLRGKTEPAKVLKRKIRKDEELDVPRTKHLHEAVSNIGKIKIDEPGTYVLTMKVTNFPKKAENGIQVSFIRMTQDN